MHYSGSAWLATGVFFLGKRDILDIDSAFTTVANITYLIRISQVTHTTNANHSVVYIPSKAYTSAAVKKEIEK